jgi:alpha-mannosidase
VKHRLVTAGGDAALATLRADHVFDKVRGPAVELRYRTQTGALLRVEGEVCGAFDREHESFVVAAQPGAEVTLEVERRSLPGTGLPPGDGPRWRAILANAAQKPALAIETYAPRSAPVREAVVPADGLALLGHSHLDIAWLWTYEEATRKGQRTLATAVRQLEGDPEFIFTQTQPQLFAFLAARDPAFFERVRAFARSGRLDLSGAAMWVEADCIVPSGESLLRQLVFGIRYVEREFGQRPGVAWLPDSFGFPNTLPTLLAHAGVGAFATTKLGWNDTTAFPYARFRWEGPDGSSVLAAQIASIEGGLEPERVANARARGDLLLIGHGDGGGGAPDAAVAGAVSVGKWTALGAWFESWRGESRELPAVRDELYLQQHRGIATTHHDVKARNAALERALLEAETLLAWARALHATPFFLDEARRQLARAWELVLCAQFHDVLPGTSIAPVYVDAHRDYDEAERLVAGVAVNARSVLPVPGFAGGTASTEPRAVRDGYVFENDALVARVARDGTLRDLRVPGGENLVRCAHRPLLYTDRPRRWDAWNIDRSYRRRRRRMRVTGCEPVDGALEVRYAFGESAAVARIWLQSGEPFLRVAWAVDWRERHALLRFENDLAFRATRARFGTPHGCVDRAPAPRTRAERAKFEACGQRFARLDGPTGGLAVLALDTYGWSLERSLRGSQLGHSVLRGPTWPDPGADHGIHDFSFAFVPFEVAGMGRLERFWERFAGGAGVPMVVPESDSVLVVATKLADDGNGIVFRARECEGASCDAVFHCGVRVRSVECVDALERPVNGDAGVDEGAIRARFRPFELRTFLVTLA